MPATISSSTYPRMLGIGKNRAQILLTPHFLAAIVKLLRVIDARIAKWLGSHPVGEAQAQPAGQLQNTDAVTSGRKSAGCCGRDAPIRLRSIGVFSCVDPSGRHTRRSKTSRHRVSPNPGFEDRADQRRSNTKRTPSAIKTTPVVRSTTRRTRSPERLRRARLIA
jgi:hypothetical protein